MLTAISIKNFRSFGASPQTISLGKMTCVVGANSSGKSNVIRALEFATSADVSRMVRSDFHISIYAGKERKAGAIEIVIDASFSGVVRRVKCVGQGTDQKGYTKKFEVDGVSYPIVEAGSFPDATLLAKLQSFSIFIAPTIRDVDYLNSALELLPLATRSSVLRSTNGLKSDLTKRLEGVCRELKIPLGVAGVSVSPAITIESLLSMVRLNFNVEDGVRLPIANLGQGHISQAILKLAQLRGGSAVTCIEEPEIHVHPSGIKGLVRTLREVSGIPEQQVIVTTHSSEVINQANFDELVCVKKEMRRSVISQINPTVVGPSSVSAMQHRVLRQDQRGVLFLSKKVLLVEGAYDRLVVEAMDRDGDIGLIDGDISVVDIGGKGQIKTYHLLLSELSRPHAVLLDSDMVFASATSAGPLESALIASRVIFSPFSSGDLAAFSRADPGRFRTAIALFSNGIAGKGVSLAAHGHHDISQALEECVLAASEADKLSAYRAFDGTMPTPTVAVMNNMLSGKALSKNAEMVELVNAFPASCFSRISRKIRKAISQLG